MFCVFFGWRNASKCKKLIKLLQYRLKLLKNKRNSIVKLLREDMSQLIQINDQEKAFNWAEQLFKEESTMAVYELLDNFCELIRSNMSYIRRNKDCPNDINEAVSSLIFASSRCGELPELMKLRKLFEERYGGTFALAASQLLPGNLVNCQVKGKLCINSVPDDVKHQLMDEIANDICHKPEILVPEYASDLLQVQGDSKHEELDKSVYTCNSRSEGHQIEPLNANKIQDIHVDSWLTNKPNNGLKQFNSHRNSDAVSISVSSSVVQQFSPDMFESPEHNKAGKVRSFAKFDSQFESTVAGDHAKDMQSGRISSHTKKHRDERTVAASSSESLPQFDEEIVVYLDDVEEFQSSKAKDGDCQDQRLFKFKPSVQPKKETVESYIDQHESLSDKSSSRSSKASERKPRRRSLSRENSNIKDIECEIYYDKPRKSSTSRHRPGRKFQSFNYNKYDRMRSGCHNHVNFLCEMNDNSLEYSCCCCIGDDKEETKFSPCKLRKGITKPVKLPVYDLNLCDHFGPCHFSHNRKSEELERHSQKPTRRSCDSGATEFNVFTYPQLWPNEQIDKTKPKTEGSDSTRSRRDASDSVSPKETIKKPVASYLTVKSMPPERLKESNTENMMRRNSFSCQYPEHVHPKLPDYDDIAAKFTALKNKSLQNKQ